MTSYADVRARVLERQPPQLREYRERQRALRLAALEAATSEPQPHDPESDQLIVGITKDTFDVADATKVTAAPTHHGRSRTPRRWFCVYHNQYHRRDADCGAPMSNLQLTRR